MPYVNVPNDLSKVKTKMALNLTKRQLICFSCAAAVGIPSYLLARGKKNHVVLGAIIVSFVLSLLAAKLLPQLSDGMRILLLTILISAGAAILFPREEPDAEEEAAARTSKKEARTV